MKIWAGWLAKLRGAATASGESAKTDPPQSELQNLTSFKHLFWTDQNVKILHLVLFHNNQNTWIFHQNSLEFPETSFKGEVRRFFLFVQSFYRPKTKTSFNRQFSPKSPKMGQKSGQRVQNSQNKDQVASDLLWESINSVLRPTVGIHQFCPPSYCGNPFIYWSGFPQ